MPAVPVARRPEARFRDLPGHPFAPHWLDVDGLRLHDVDEGAGPPVLLLPGEPTWSFLHREEAGDQVGRAIAAVVRDGVSPPS